MPSHKNGHPRTIQSFNGDTTIQLSTNASSFNNSPSIEISSDGKVWVAYVSDSSYFVAGYFEQGAWSTVVYAKAPKGLCRSCPVKATIEEFANSGNEKPRIWYLYTDSLNVLRVGFFKSETSSLQIGVEVWVGMDSPGISDPNIPRIYDITPNHGRGVWYTKPIGPDSLGQWYAAGNTVLEYVGIGFDPIIYGIENSYVNQLVTLSTLSDSILTFFGIYYSYQGMRLHWFVNLYLSSSASRNVQIIESGLGDGTGDWTRPLTMGSDGRSILAITEYTGYSGSVEYHVYLRDGVTMQAWRNVISQIDQRNYQRFTQISASKSGPGISLVWVSHDIMNAKMFLNGRWMETKPIVDAISDSLRSEVKIVVGKDSTQWVVFSAMKNNQRHIFLSRIRPNFSVDSLLVGVREPSQAKPQNFALLQNYPNPFNPVTHIQYQLPNESKVTLKIYNILGQLVSILVDEVQSPGNKSVVFDGSHLPSGVYFYHLHAGAFSEVKKLILAK
jgi:hypothetical protein